MLKTQSLMSEWSGEIKLVYHHQNKQTKIINSSSKSPFKIQNPFYPEGEEICHSIILHTAGGIVGGDILNQDICLEENAKTLISTPAASKIYKTNGKQAQQNIKMIVKKGACLEFLPQENIIFNQANYCQNLRVELEPEAIYFSWEINRFGRSAMGEKFVQGQWKSSTEVFQKTKPLWIDRQIFQGVEMFDPANGLAGKPIMGTLTLIGQNISSEIIDKIRHLWHNRDINNNSNNYNQGEAGVTQLINGLLCRYRGNSTLEVKQWFFQVWHLLRLNYLKKPALKLRIW